MSLMCHSGVRQGIVMSFWLFSLFMDEGLHMCVVNGTFENSLHSFNCHPVFADQDFEEEAEKGSHNGNSAEWWNHC